MEGEKRVRALSLLVFLVGMGLLISGLVLAGTTTAAGSPTLRHTNHAVGQQITRLDGSVHSPLVTNTVTVTIQSFAFSPNVVTITVGDRVVWQNLDGQQHSATTLGIAGNNPPENFSTPVINTGNSASYVFTLPGIYEYRCGLHSGMRGRIVVLPALTPTATPYPPSVWGVAPPYVAAGSDVIVTFSGYSLNAGTASLTINGVAQEVLTQTYYDLYFKVPLNTPSIPDPANVQLTIGGQPAPVYVQFHVLPPNTATATLPPGTTPTRTPTPAQTSCPLTAADQPACLPTLPPSPTRTPFVTATCNPLVCCPLGVGAASDREQPACLPTTAAPSFTPSRTRTPFVTATCAPSVCCAVSAPPDGSDQILCTPSAVASPTRTVSVTATPPPCGGATLFSDDMESGTANWQVDGYGDLWGVVTDSVHSPTHAWFGPDANQSGNSGDKRLAMTTAIQLPTNAGSLRLSFWHRHSFYTSYSYIYVDGGVVEYSTDGGSTWQDADPLFIQNGYNGYIYPPAGTATPTSTSTPSAMGSNQPNVNPLAGRHAFVYVSGWRESVLNLNSLAGQSVRFRFRLGSAVGSGFEGAGWHVDDVLIQSVPACTTPTPSPTRTLPVGPYVDDIIPEQAVAGSSTEVTLWGSNLNGPNPILTVNGVPQTIISQSSTSIVFYVTAGTPSTPDPASVMLTVNGQAATFGPNASFRVLSGSGATTTPSASPTATIPNPSPTFGCLADAPLCTTTPVPTTAVPTGTPGIPTITPTPCNRSFSDVPQGYLFHDDIIFLACRGVINGFGDGTFRPNNNTTRGELAKIVVNGLGLTISTPATPTFSDVPPSHPFYAFIETLAQRQIVIGFPCSIGNCFAPNNPVRRGELAKFIVNARGYALVNPGAPTFADVPQSNIFYQYIETLTSRSIVGGAACVGGGGLCYRPGDSIRRGELSKVVHRAIDQPTEPPAAPGGFSVHQHFEPNGYTYPQEAVWQDNATNEDGYYLAVYQTICGESGCTQVLYSSFYLPANSTSYTFSSLRSGASASQRDTPTCNWQFRLQAYNGMGSSTPVTGDGYTIPCV